MASFSRLIGCTCAHTHWWCGWLDGSWRCVKVKLINLVFISWYFLCLARSYASTKRHRGANNYPAMFRTAPQAQSTRRALGADQVGKSRLFTSFTSLFTNSPAWPLPATVSIDQMHVHCRVVKATFGWELFSMPAPIFLPNGSPPESAGGWWSDVSQRSEWRSQNVQ